MARKAFYSFHYKADSWRASTVRNIGVIEGNRPCSDNDWESITKGGDAAVQRWIDSQLSGKSVAIVLIGANTAGRKWITYEIKRAWQDSKGVMGIHVHKLEDQYGLQSLRGKNPFSHLTVDGKSMSSIVEAYDPPFSLSKHVYGHIEDNLADWIETAIQIRKCYG